VEVEEVWRRHAQRRPELGDAQERLGRAIERAKRFKHAVELARETITRIAMDTHRKWAEFLNERVADILRAFGCRVESLRFGEDLEFSAQLDGGPLVSRGKAHAQLSAGARDQLYLAVRLAISEYLSRGGEALPLLLDDVFATSDDARLRAGMRTLIESFGAGHQVVVTTCHRGRMQELRKLDPDLYRDRVHWVDLQAGSGARTR
jgi:DNA repair exonuclease SbcCD ATPase subunit